jgi:hypothetical protein
LESVRKQKGPNLERRQRQPDRRRTSRSGRRSNDPHGAWHWRRIAWLFAAYVAVASVRSLPQTLTRLFKRSTPA